MLVVGINTVCIRRKRSDALLYNVGYIPEGEQQTEVLGARYRVFKGNGRWEYVLSRDHVGNQAEKFVGNTGTESDRQWIIKVEKLIRVSIFHIML